MQLVTGNKYILLLSLEHEQNNNQKKIFVLYNLNFYFFFNTTWKFASCVAVENLHGTAAAAV